METISIVEARLRYAPGEALCDWCLSFACTVSLIEIRVTAEHLARSNPSFQRSPSCASCCRIVPSLLYRQSLSGKCGHCSQPIQMEVGVRVIGDDLFHATCLQRLVTNETIPISRHLSPQSRRVIEESRRRIQRSRLPFDPPARAASPVCNASRSPATPQPTQEARSVGN